MKRYRIVNEWPSNRLKVQRFNGTEQGRYAIIYGLCEPVDRERPNGIVTAGTVRYVGQTWEPHRRYRRHLTRTAKGDTRCGRWIRVLKRLDLEPKHILLEQGFYQSQAELDEAEQKWIALWRCAPGKDWLTNHTAGGYSRGQFIGEAGEESKRKMSQAARSEKRLAQLAEFQNDPDIQARRKASVAKAQQDPEWRELMRQKLASYSLDPAIQEKRRNVGKSESNLARLREAALIGAKWKLEDTIHILRPHRFGSHQRAQLLSLIRDGMTVGKFLETASPLGLDTRHILGKFINVFRIVEIRKAKE
jgi:hypothetical protein